MFQSQRSTHPFVHIAHEMTQFSDADVTVFSNCDIVRLTTYQGAPTFMLPVLHRTAAVSHAPVVVTNAWEWW